jgi:hypothetical protein
MTTDQRLHAALTAVAEELRVTEEEHAHAHHRFIHRRELLARRRRRTHGLVAAAVAAALVLGGSAVWRELGDATSAPQPAGTEQEQPLPEELPLSVDTLAGIWLTHDSTGWLWAFHRNGTLVFANPTARGLQAYEPVAYTVTGSGIELPDDLCDWELQVNSDGTMVGQVVRVPDPPDSPCAGADQVRWYRLSPRSDHGASFVWTGSHGEDEETQALRLHAAPTDVESVGVLSRTWLQQGTGRLLAVTLGDGQAPARYRLDDAGELFSSPADVGEAVVDSAGRLLLVSTEDSPGCPAGSTAVLGDVVLRGTGGTVPPLPAPSLEVTLGAHECSLHEELGGVWVQVS